MDSTIFNRRTLLGSGALVGLGPCLRHVVSRLITRRQPPPPPRRARPLLRLPQHLSHLRQVLPLNRRLLADIQDNPKHPTVNTVRPMAMDPHRTSPSLVMSLLSTLKLKKASII